MKNKYLKTNTKYKANMKHKLAQEEFEYQLKKALEEGAEKSISKKKRGRSYESKNAV